MSMQENRLEGNAPECYPTGSILAVGLLEIFIFFCILSTFLQNFYHNNEKKKCYFKKTDQIAFFNNIILWQLGGMEWRGRWEGGSGRRGHMYAYGQFMLMYGKKPSQHCKVIIFQFKKKNNV